MPTTRRKAKESRKGEIDLMLQDIIRDYPLSTTPEPKAYVPPTSSMKNKVKEKYNKYNIAEEVGKVISDMGNKKK